MRDLVSLLRPVTCWYIENRVITIVLALLFIMFLCCLYFYFQPILRVCPKTWMYIWNCVVEMISWNNINWNQYLFFVPFTWCLWNRICWWKSVFTVMGHNCRCLVWQTMEASVSLVGVNGLMVMLHMIHLSFSADDIVFLHFHVTVPGMLCLGDIDVIPMSRELQCWWYFVFTFSLPVHRVLLCSVLCRVVFYRVHPQS